MKAVSPIHKLSRYYFAAGVAEGILALFLFLRIPADPKNAWIFGFSKTRLLLVIGLLALTAFFAWLTKKVWQNPEAKLNQWFKTLLEEFSIFLPLMALLYGVAIYVSFDYLLQNTQNLTTLQGYLVRLAPFIIFLMFRLGQVVVVAIIAPFIHKPEPREQGTTVFVTQYKWMFRLGGIMLLLILVNVLGEVVSVLTWDIRLGGWGPKFDLSRERNVPSYMSSFNLGVSGLLLALIAGVKKSRRESYVFHWSLLATIFFLFSMDEIAGIHEWSVEWGRLIVPQQGIFYFS
jgi:hypothetical protein